MTHAEPIFSLTEKQWKMLEILSHFSGMGTIEVELAWGGYDFGDSEAEESKAWRTNRLVVASLVRSLAAKGYATLHAPDPEVGYGITEAGRALLEKRWRWKDAQTRKALGL